MTSSHGETLLAIETTIILIRELNGFKGVITVGEGGSHVEFKLELALFVAGGGVAADLDADVVDGDAVEGE